MAAFKKLPISHTTKNLIKKTKHHKHIGDRTKRYKVDVTS